MMDAVIAASVLMDIPAPTPRWDGPGLSGLLTVVGWIFAICLVLCVLGGIVSGALIGIGKVLDNGNLQSKGIAGLVGSGIGVAVCGDGQIAQRPDVGHHAHRVRPVRGITKHHVAAGAEIAPRGPGRLRQRHPACQGVAPQPPSQHVVLPARIRLEIASAAQHGHQRHLFAPLRLGRRRQLQRGAIIGVTELRQLSAGIGHVRGKFDCQRQPAPVVFTEQRQRILRHQCSRQEELIDEALVVEGLLAIDAVGRMLTLDLPLQQRMGTRLPTLAGRPQRPGARGNEPACRLANQVVVGRRVQGQVT